MSNRLAHESSPYLRQHAHNPVDWYPWGEEALGRARELDRPIFLSIGYSACHWCHVMEKESFEDAAIGKLLNDHFVSIKVDREERPDLDQIYMTAVQILTQQGGWPMSMFLTPDLKPFFGGTYFPPDDRYGRPGFGRLLTMLAEAWREKRAVVEEQANHLTGHVQGYLNVEAGADGTLGPELLRNVGNTLRRAFDIRHGGFGSAPKFPHPMELRLLLRLWKRFGDDEALRMAQVTLDRMAMGGIYDHLGGGFHRYSTDAQWLVPHFEKMLYDNALLTSAYVEAFQATRNPFYREVIDETLGYVLREMTSTDGAFFSTQDADSEGEEGKFFVWTLGEVQSLLGPDAELFAQVYDVSAEGNWEGHNILHRSKTYEQDAKLLRVPEDEMRRRLAAGKQKLFEARSRRVWPGKDDKVLTAWNALMLGAFAQAGAALDHPPYLEAARRAADFLLTRMQSPGGLLFRTTSPSGQPKLNAYLEDYAYLIDSLVSLYEATFEPRWIKASLAVTETMFAEFWDDKDGGFFYTGKTHEQLIARTKDPHDSSVPSGNSVAVTALLRLAKLTGRSDLFDRAEKTLRLFHGLLGSSPLAAGQMLIALDFYLGPVQEICVVGEPAKLAVKEAVNLLHRSFLPNTVLALRSDTVGAEVEEMIPLLANREAKGDVTTYVCQNFTCQAPLVGVEALTQRLDRPQRQER